MDLDAAYVRCAEITSREAKNFAYGIKLLPGPKRRAMCAVYAMARRIDDIGDGDLPSAQKLTALAGVRKDIEEMATLAPTSAPLRRSAALGDDAVLVALADATHRYELPLDEFDLLIQGCEMDVNGARYNTFDDLVGYCRRVAGSIGKLSLAIFGTRYAESAGPRAEALGVALQVTNILRDVVEDRGMGRVYLPLDDLARFGVTEEDLRAGHRNEAFLKLMRFEADRARAYYNESQLLLDLIHPRSRPSLWALVSIYSGLLERIKHSNYDVFTRRVRLSSLEKSWIVVRALVS